MAVHRNRPDRSGIAEDEQDEAEAGDPARRVRPAEAEVEARYRQDGHEAADDQRDEEIVPRFGAGLDAGARHEDLRIDAPDDDHGDQRADEEGYTKPPAGGPIERP